ncbi:Iron-sulfur cluster co-chaperone protein HscB, mitochondrial [Tritrichomonas foetus]|uniref:Iron-sulfur cluster co-chaperone protein HscB, mitochondrial n=1 Tax=Tritrichomonas foetus TaxID=1144522 RepID=A0A1J4KKQ8_9EUKA|nr:Iron-sulfur cluster co-chaperone protein HscB, mitochondrial [Tritrichomonas foetus]|eukprot:OHT11889.1 Iron-sulfur cluster co-chaperone protein HscB, mitochondrial [Tritrichomonas foetus]
MLQFYKSRFARFFVHDCKQTCCWNCHKMIKHKDCEFFCKNCNKLLPTEYDNYFSLFDLPKDYDIDPSKLLKTYKGYQRQIHPDRFFQASKNEISNADHVSSCVNQGYKTLSDPVKRGEYMLQLFKFDTKADVPPDFLMKVLDIHEQIDSASESSDLVKLMAENQKDFREENAKLKESLRVDGDKVADPHAAAESLAKMKYLSRIRDAIREKLPVDLL